MWSNYPKGCTCAFQCYWIWRLVTDAQFLYDTYYINRSKPYSWGNPTYSTKNVYTYIYCLGLSTFQCPCTLSKFPHRLESNPVGQTSPLTLVLDLVLWEWVCGSQTCSDSVMHLHLTALGETRLERGNNNVCVWRRNFNNWQVIHFYSTYDIIHWINDWWHRVLQNKTFISSEQSLNFKHTTASQ